MMQTASGRSKATTIAARIGTMLTAVALTLGISAGTALAATPRYSGDFSWRATEVKRLANCSATQWYNDSRVGSQITGCSGSDSYWDSTHLVAASYLSIDARQVGYRADQSCPPKRGFQYVKCYYVGGKARGNPVMTVSIISYGSGGMDVAVDWYYL
ncbi:hypothetical protein RKE30_38080 [Streptomyces sp. Li-HN-5-11]|uniref:hypothetical protein n=1 Tax=Streptomyces sp. Li-HN-5-11 TaxID=3075432 RepID=UPI0028AAFD7F|nr:hypothetical protein [Streptomyces sp. Li-HN-5-11]WNM35762.1 hypothetical protein RKE30_38080 [Streptomyces sp. Li-HN-5-11]